MNNLLSITNVHRYAKKHNLPIQEATALLRRQNIMEAIEKATTIAELRSCMQRMASYIEWKGTP